MTRPTCERGKWYATRDDAERSSKTCTCPGKEPLVPYECDRCGGWHLRKCGCA